MCGIAGIIGKTYGSRESVQKMVTAMHHRGPDDSGVFTDEEVAIGMARLAILDLSPLGHQPMQSHCKRYWIVYNGECYNFREIRKKLEALGNQFKSNSDTEVVLQAYVRWGAECLSRMNGMFAFAIWDTLEKKLFAARDRFGIKPFYYSKTNNLFVFASEIKSLLASGQIDFNIDPDSVFHYFTLGYIQQPTTILSNVYSLLPAHFLTWQGSEITTACYWDFSKVTPGAISYEEAKIGIVDHLKASVKKQMISDRSLGIFLSGGLDSASVLASMSMNNANIKSFSLSFEDTSVQNEETDAQALAIHFGAEHHQLKLGIVETVNHLDKYFESLDQPSLDGLNTYLISKFASNEITVALSGLGGDELFLGYSWQRNLLLRHRSANKLNQFVARVLNPSLLNSLLKVSWVDTLSRLRTRFGFENLSTDYINLALSAQGGLHNNYKLLSNSVQRASHLPDIHRSLTQTLKSPNQTVPFVEASYLTSKSFMSSQLLRDMDAVSMAHSLEVRFPLIDHELFEFAVALPDNFKVQTLKKSREQEETYQTNTSKRILLDAMLPYLPDSFMSRKKNGFKVPFYSILNQMPTKELGSRIFDSKSTWKEWLDVKEIQTFYGQSKDSGSFSISWWKILTFVSVLNSLKRAADFGK